MRIFSVLAICLCIGFFPSCSSDDTSVTSLCPEIEESEQTALFQFYKDQLIIPAYEQALSDLGVLNTSLDDLLNEPTVENLSEARAAFRTAYLSWEYAEPFYFGPAEDQLIEDHFNYFPLNRDSLQFSIDEGFDSDLTEKYDRGFPAMDYLFYFGSEAEILEYITNSAVRAYLLANMDNMVNRLTQVVEEWNGSFGSTFVSNTGKVDGASLSQIINTYNRHFETIKRNRIGLASGVLTLGFKNPSVVEGFYSGLSLDLAKAAVESSSNYFYGGSGTDSQRGIYQLLNDLNIQVGNESLANKMDATIVDFSQLLNDLNSSLDAAVINEEAAVSELYQSMSSYVVLAKTDMPTALCISITYVDNPSDSD